MAMINIENQLALAGLQMLYFSGIRIIDNCMDTYVKDPVAASSASFDFASKDLGGDVWIRTNPDFPYKTLGAIFRDHAPTIVKKYYKEAANFYENAILGEILHPDEYYEPVLKAAAMLGFELMPEKDVIGFVENKKYDFTNNAFVKTMDNVTVEYLHNIKFPGGSTLWGILDDDDFLGAMSMFGNGKATPYSFFCKEYGNVGQKAVLDSFMFAPDEVKKAFDNAVYTAGQRELENDKKMFDQRISKLSSELEAFATKEDNIGL